MKYLTKYATKFLPERNGRALRGPLTSVPIGTELKQLQKVATEHGRALFSANVNSKELFGYQDIDCLETVTT